MTAVAGHRAGRPAPGTPPGPPRPRAPILMYHEISRQPSLDPRLAVTPADFARQLEYLAANGYTSLTVTQLVQTMTGRARWPAKPVVLTFDDGYADFYLRALPLLTSFGCTGTVFVTTGWIADAGPDSSGDGPCNTLCWSQIADTAGAGIEIGAHGHHHAELDQLAAGQLREELTSSMARLQDRLSVPVTGMAYPFGYSNRGVRMAVAAAGYRHACAVGNRILGDQIDLFALPRVTIGRSTRLPAFARVVRGDHLPPQYLGYRMLTRGQAAVRRARRVRNRISR